MRCPEAYDSWHRALKARCGIVLQTNDPQRAKVELYEARKNLLPDLPELAEFSILSSPTSQTELWLARKAQIDAAKAQSRAASKGDDPPA